MTDCLRAGCKRGGRRIRGYCKADYYAAIRSGELAPRSADPVVRFWARVDKGGPVPEFRAELGPCWLWTGGISNGYGRADASGQTLYAHRVAYELATGVIPSGLHIDHLCRVTTCVNPQHLEPVTVKENIDRGFAGAINAARMTAKTHCPKRHPYDAGNTYTDKRGYRSCKTCVADASRRYRAKRARAH